MAQAYMTETDGGGGSDCRGSRLRRLVDSVRIDRRIWRRGIVLAVFAILLALVMLLHAQVPNTLGNLGSLTETFLPWLGVFIPVWFGANATQVPRVVTPWGDLSYDNGRGQPIVTGDQVFAFELTGALLVVAVAGTVVLTRRQRERGEEQA